MIPNRNTPWGFSDYARQIAPGIVYYGTPSHGGAHVSAELEATIPADVRAIARHYAPEQWYEEDTDIFIPLCLLPGIPYDRRREAIKYAREYPVWKSENTSRYAPLVAELDRREAEMSLDDKARLWYEHEICACLGDYAEVDDFTDDEWAWSIGLTLGSQEINMTFTIASEKVREGEGEGIGVILSIVESGGRIIAQDSAYNYTPKVWTTDLDEFRERMNAVLSRFNVWMAEVFVPAQIERKSL